MKKVFTQIFVCGKNIRIPAVLAVLVFLSSFTYAHAFEAILDVDNHKDAGRGYVTARVFIETEGEAMNAVEGTLLFSDGLLRVREIQDGNSFVSLWIHEPEVSLGSISYSGGTPGGYTGTIVPPGNTLHPGEVFTVFFDVVGTGDAFVAVQDTRVYLHDGRGTEIHVSDTEKHFSVIRSEDQIFTVESEDATPPEVFEITLVTHPDLYDGLPTLVFSTKDLGTGVEYYEVKEAGKEWVRAKSPYPLREPPTHSLFVKAVDRAGNIRIVEYIPNDRADAFMFLKDQKKSILLLIFAVFFASVGILLFLRRRGME